MTPAARSGGDLGPLVVHEMGKARLSVFRKQTGLVSADHRLMESCPIGLCDEARSGGDEEPRRIGDGTCIDCGHDLHPLRSCHEIIGAIGGDPSNGPDYCRCTIDYLNGAMEAEIARLTRAATPPSPAAGGLREHAEASLRNVIDALRSGKPLNVRFATAILEDEVLPALASPSSGASSETAGLPTWEEFDAAYCRARHAGEHLGRPEGCGSYNAAAIFEELVR